MPRLLEILFDLGLMIVAARIISMVVRQFFGGTPVRFSGRPPTVVNRQNRTVSGNTSRDPVCGMFVSTEVSHRLERDGKTLHFCSHECLQRFEKEENKKDV